MCGRYALALRPSEVRQRLEDEGMPSSEAPDDDDPKLRQSYNFAPGYYGLVYRADTPDHGAGPAHEIHDGKEAQHGQAKKQDVMVAATGNEAEAVETRYKLQSMKWGLIPFWTKRNPDYGSMMRTINCRDDSLSENRGMWNTMKQKKRCIIVCQGFYEWQKKNGGKIPHFVKRKDGQLMCFAGLWDCAKFEGTEDKLYTYTVITTDSNKQLKFLHDRMPVILDNGSEEIRTWLDPKRAEWSRELQSLLKPYDGELECYPVSKDVGKVGNNSPSFIVPIDSTENKNNIANFFGNQKKAAKIQEERLNVKKEDEGGKGKDVKAEQREDTRKTEDHDGTEDNAPLPVPEDKERAVAGVKREHTEAEDSDDATDQASPRKAQKTTANQPSPEKAPKTIRRTRNATSNSPLTKKASPKVASDGSKKITNFFNK
ncbi:hypothetical protein B0A49_07989 [Cryomyces minteri]|uniref:DUF159 domain protein n=1 Tax=Cryomyces minteri TaxID=331657 RepID=A0A4U0WN85_9PEZI|nr:hypothetical protein B0A49_07989 [Cryomyces minteri]